MNFRRSPWIVVAYAATFLIFARIRAFADGTGVPIHYRYPIEVDRLLFAGHAPTVVLQSWAGQTHQLIPLDYVFVLVYTSYFVLPHLIAFLLWKQRSPDLLPFIASFIGTLYLGLLVIFLVPTAPPWLAAQRGYLPPVVRVVPILLNSFVGGIFGTGDRMAGPNDVAAMPSLHMAGACIVALYIARWGRVGAVAGTLYAAWMALALVFLGEHYTLDLLVGTVLTVVVWWLVHALWPHRRQRRAARTGRAAEDRAQPSQVTSDDG